MTNPIVVGIVVAVVTTFLSHCLTLRREERQAKERQTEREKDAQNRREERLAEAAERRADRLNEQRVALYAEVLAWAETSSRETDLPSALLTARVKILAGDAVREEFAGLVLARSNVNKADLIDDAEVIDRVARLTHREPDDLRAMARSELGVEWVKLSGGVYGLEQVCRAELLGLAGTQP